MRQLITGAMIVGSLVACTNKETIKIIEQSPATQSSKEIYHVDGVVNGGGGKGVLCQKDGQTTVETLDLFEARYLYQLELLPNPSSEQEMLELSSRLFDRHFGNSEEEPPMSLSETLQLLNTRFIDSNKRLKLTQDSLEPLIPKECEIVQVAILYNEDTLLIDQELWNQMNWLNKGSLIMHEIIYLLDRQYAEATDSVKVRKLVGQMLSKQGATPILPENIASQEHLYCLLKNDSAAHNSPTIFFGQAHAVHDIDEGVAGVRFYFSTLKGLNLFRTSAFIPYLSLEKIKLYAPGQTIFEEEPSNFSSEHPNNLGTHYSGQISSLSSELNQKRYMTIYPTLTSLTLPYIDTDFSYNKELEAFGEPPTHPETTIGSTTKYTYTLKGYLHSLFAQSGQETPFELFCSLHEYERN